MNLFKCFSKTSKNKHPPSNMLIPQRLPAHFEVRIAIGFYEFNEFEYRK